MRNIFVILLVFICIAASPANAQNNLQHYLNAAFGNNPSLKENLNIAKINEIDKSLIERQFVYPQVSLTSNYLFSPYFNNNGKLITANPDPNAVGYDIGITNGGLYSAMINVDKNIFNGGTIDAYRNQSDLKIQSSKNANTLLKHNLIRDVTEQYLNTIKWQQYSEIEKTLYDTIKTQLNLTEVLVKKGLAKQSDFLLLKIEVDNERLAFEQARSEFKKNLLELNSLCGISDTNSVTLESADLSYGDLNSNSNFLKQFALDSLSIDNQQKIFETKYAPQVNLFFNTGLNAVELDGIQRKFGLSAGINFSLPLYDGSQKNLTQQQTEISLKSINGYKQNQVVTLLNKTAQTRGEIDLYKKNLKNITGQINSYEELLKLARAEFAQGQRTMTDYIILIRNYLEMKRNLVETENSLQQAINQYNYWNW